MATGVRQRHGNGCNGKGRCDCPWRAEVYSKRDGRKLRKTFPTQAAAKVWRADKLAAANKGKLRAPTSMTVRQAAEAFMAGARDGSIPTASGTRYKPATLRGYRVGLDKRLMPTLGGMRLSDVERRDVQELANRADGRRIEREHRAEHARPAARHLSACDPRRRSHGRPDRAA